MWVNSAAHPCVQVADVAAWVLRRAAAQPAERETREMFQVIKPLLAGEQGITFELFSVAPRAGHARSGRAFRRLRRGVLGGGQQSVLDAAGDLALGPRDLGTAPASEATGVLH
jgi:hypothetical protein